MPQVLNSDQACSALSEEVCWFEPRIVELLEE
jgi:hypothetical protein